MGSHPRVIYAITLEKFSKCSAGQIVKCKLNNKEKYLKFDSLHYLRNVGTATRDFLRFDMHRDEYVFIYLSIRSFNRQYPFEKIIAIRNE